MINGWSLTTTWIDLEGRIVSRRKDPECRCGDVFISLHRWRLGVVPFASVHHRCHQNAVGAISLWPHKARTWVGFNSAHKRDHIRAMECEAIFYICLHNVTKRLSLSCLQLIIPMSITQESNITTIKQERQNVLKNPNFGSGRGTHYTTHLSTVLHSSSSLPGGVLEGEGCWIPF
jgi:hypothetical protein